MTTDRLPESKLVWTTLATNTKYLDGVVALDYSLKRVNSKYPLIVLYTDTFEEQGHQVLDKFGIYKRKISYLLPTEHKDYSNDPRFYDCWSKLQPFSLFEYDRVVQLDSDMIVTQNMDELLSIPLGNAAFAASYACVCNPYNKEHYPKDWVAANCMFTGYKAEGEHWQGPGFDQPKNKILMCNGGLQVVEPRKETYEKITAQLNSPATGSYDFADQSLLSDLFEGNWVPLSYKYNALKTLRTIHSDLWNDDEVKNVHYIMNPKPWETTENDDTGTFEIWHKIEHERVSK